MNRDPKRPFSSILWEILRWPVTYYECIRQATHQSEGIDRINGQQLQQLFDAHGAALVLYARQWCVCPDDALQDALIDLNRQVLAPNDPVAWLFTTVRCKAINLARSEQRRSKYHRQVAEQRDPWFSIEPSSELESKELEGMLTELGPLEREIVVARIWGEMTFEQIAKLVGRSVSVVHRSYQRALKTLEQRLDGQNEPEKKMSKFL